MVEEYIKGREFSVGFVTGKAYRSSSKLLRFGSSMIIRINIRPGSTFETCPAEISPELTEKMQHYAGSRSQSSVYGKDTAVLIS